MKKILITILSVFCLISAQAQNARINVLTQNLLYPGASNFLLHDEAQIQLYPSLMFDYGTHGMVNAPVVTGAGNITGTYGYGSIMHTGEKLGLGMYMGRPFNFPAFGAVIPLDLVGAYDFGKVKAGLIFSMENVNTADTLTHGHTINKIGGVGVQPSISLQLGESNFIDISIPFSMGNINGSTDDTIINADIAANGFGFNGRFHNDNFTIPVTILNYKSVSTSGPDSMTNTSEVGLTYFFVGVAHDHHFDKNNFVTMGLFANNGGFATHIQSGDSVLSDGKNSAMAVVALVGGEINIHKKWYVRGSYSYQITNSVKNANVTSDLGFPGNVSFGFSFKCPHIDLHAALSTDLLYNGPNFITGNTSNFIPTITLIARP